MEKITDEDLRAMLTKNEETPELVFEVLPDETVELIDEPVTLEEDTLLQDTLEQEIDFNTIPEKIEDSYEEKSLDPVLVKRNELSVGLTPEDIQDLYLYVSGKGSKPLFIDKFTSDTEGRLKDMTVIMTMTQLAQIPTLTALRNQVQERLFDPANLYDMDSKTLSATLANLDKNINAIIENSIKAVQTTSQFGTLNNEYRKILDGVMMLPTEKLEMLRSAVLEDNLEK